MLPKREVIGERTVRQKSITAGYNVDMGRRNLVLDQIVAPAHCCNAS